MKYFFDNCVSYKYALMLRALDVDATPLRGIFAQDAADAQFLAELQHRGFEVYISCDLKQRTRPVEAVALANAGITALYFAPFWDKMRFWLQAAWLTARWERIDAFAMGAARGTCAEIKHNGRAAPFHPG
ncbi:MAG: hypothetical protein HYS13_19350 [Planctomycetia bacterium]|nr:hypothetical protein [Planctomycetia bacterium]